MRRPSDTRLIVSAYQAGRSARITRITPSMRLSMTYGSSCGSGAYRPDLASWEDGDRERCTPDFWVRQVPAIRGTRKWRHHRLPRWAELVIRPWGATIGRMANDPAGRTDAGQMTPGPEQWQMEGGAAELDQHHLVPALAARLGGRPGGPGGPAPRRARPRRCLRDRVVAHVAAERVDRSGARRWDRH
jgi:hypothetical protein